MAAPAAVLQILVDANTGLAERKLGKFEGKLSRTQFAAKKFSKAVDLAGVAAAGLATYGLYKAVDAGVKFERQLSTLGAVSNASAKEMKRLEQQALKLGESTVFTAKEVAEAQTELAKGGLTVKQIYGGGTKAALALAAAGQLELAEAATTTVNAMKLFGIQAKDAEKVADAFATAANKTTGDVSDFALAMKQGGSAVKAAGGDLNEAITILEALAETGIKGSDAGTSMKTALIQLSAPTKKQAELQKALNLQFFDQNGNLKKASALSAEFTRVLEGKTGQEKIAIAKTLAGTDGFRTLLALYDQGPAKLRKLEQANKKQGTAQEVAAKQMNNFQGELEELQGAAETLGIRIFKVMKPALQETVHWATELTKEVSAIFSDETLSGPEKFKKAFGLIINKLVPLFERTMTSLAEVSAENAPKVALAFVKGFISAGIWGKLFTAAYLFGKFGGAGGGFTGLGKGAGAKFAKGFIAGMVIFEAGKKIADIINGDKTGETTKEALAKRLNEAFTYATKQQAKILAGNRVSIATGIGELIFSSKTQTVIAAKGSDLQKFVGRKLNNSLAVALQSTKRTVGRESQKVIQEAADRLARLADVGDKKAGDFKNKVGGQFQELAMVTQEAMGNITTSLSSLLQSLNLPKPKGFNVNKALKEMPELKSLPRTKKQRGGPINLGAPSGDSVPAMLERGEYVLNRKAVAAVGRNQLDAINFGAAPRFQKGGALEHPHIAGPEPLRAVGQGAVDKVYDAADKMYKAAKAQANALGGGKASGSVSSHPELQPGISAIVATILRRFPGLSITSTTGGGHATNSYHYQGRAADLGASVPYMLSAAGWIKSNLGRNLAEGIHNPNLSIDEGHEVSPGFWGASTWAGHLDHIHVAKQRGGFISGLLRRMASGGAVVRKAGEVMGRNGLDLVSSAGIMGNSYQESGWNTEAMEPGTHNGGLFGFTAGEKSLSSLESFAAKRGKPWGDTQTQVQFMLSTLPTSMRNKMNSMSKVDETTPYFMNEWEKPLASAANLPRRLQGAHMAVKIMKGLSFSGKESDEHTYKEDVPARWHGLRTDSLNLSSSTPKSLIGIEKELRKRRKEIKRYRAGVEEAKKKDRPGLAQALQHNVTALDTRIRELERARAEARREAAKKKFTKHLSRALGKLTGMEKPIGLAEHAFNSQQQFVEQLVDLEPLAPELGPGASSKAQEGAETKYVGDLFRYINEREAPAYADLLGKASDWRNEILRAERLAAGHWEKPNTPLGGLEGNWENRIIALGQQIRDSERLIQKAADDRSEYKSKHKDAHFKDFPDWLQKEIRHARELQDKLPMLRFQEGQLRHTLGEGQEEFYPGGSRIKDNPTPPNPGSGSFEDSLQNVQGIHWPGQHERLKALPTKRVAGKFGGIIWDVQSQIEGLDLAKLSALRSLGGGEAEIEAGGAESSDIASGIEGLDFSNFDEMFRQIDEAIRSGIETIGKANQPRLVYERQAPILERFAGFHAKGGFIPNGMWGIAGEAGPEIVRGPAQVYSNSESVAMTSTTATPTPVQVEVRVLDGAVDVEKLQVLVNGEIQKSNRQGGRSAKTFGARVAGRQI